MIESSYLRFHVSILLTIVLGLLMTDERRLYYAHAKEVINRIRHAVLDDQYRKIQGPMNSALIHGAKNT